MWYKLDENNKPVQASDIHDYLELSENSPLSKPIAQEHVGSIFISTVFLGLDHSWNSEIPILWETMIFGGEHDQYQERYTSYEDALEGHKVALNLVNIKK
jgi:hypothetical protein